MKDVADLIFVVANKASFAKNSTDSLEGKTALFPDCTVSISHRWQNQITQHPIERGVSVADHIIAENAVFEVSGIFNQYSLQSYNNNAVEGESKIKNAYDYLLALRDQRIPFTLVSKYQSYEDCVVKSLEIPVAPTDGNNTLIFSMTIQQIRFGEVGSVTLVRATEVADPFKDAAAGKQSLGNKQVTLSVIENSPFAPKGTKTVRVQDQLTKIPYAFGGG